MLSFGLNKATQSEMPLGEFFKTAARLDCIGMKLRKLFDRPVFDRIDPTQAGARIGGQACRSLARRIFSAAGLTKPPATMISTPAFSATSRVVRG